MRRTQNRPMTARWLPVLSLSFSLSLSWSFLEVCKGRAAATRIEYSYGTVIVINGCIALCSRHRETGQSVNMPFVGISRADRARGFLFQRRPKYK